MTWDGLRGWLRARGWQRVPRPNRGQEEWSFPFKDGCPSGRILVISVLPSPEAAQKSAREIEKTVRGLYHTDHFDRVQRSVTWSVEFELQIVLNDKRVWEKRTSSFPRSCEEALIEATSRLQEPGVRNVRIVGAVSEE